MKNAVPICLCCLALLFSCSRNDTGQDADGGVSVLEETSKNHFYTFTYPSVDSEGKPVELSAALMAWNRGKARNECIETVLVGCHVTIDSNDRCPTMYPVSLITEDTWAMYVLAVSSELEALGHCIVIMPDYEGFGVSQDHTHPYLARELTGRQVSDALRYGLGYYNATEGTIPLSENWKTICTGYSQGGSVALATQRYMEENGLAEQFHLAGSLCGDGPYDIIATLRYYLEDDGGSYGVSTSHRKNRTSMPEVLPMIINGMLSSHPAMRGHKASDYLTGYAASGDLSRIFTPECYAWMTDKSRLGTDPLPDGSPMGDLHYALWDNSLCHGWEPAHRIVFAHSKYDTIVPFGNYESFVAEHPSAPVRLNVFCESDNHIAAGTFYKDLIIGQFDQDLEWLLEGGE